MIYLHLARYSKAMEFPVDDAPELLFAGHRKWAGAYALSQRGLARPNSSGYRDSIFPVDDFLPALHSFHPRPDVRDLPCVQTVCATGDFVALTFPDGSGIVDVAD